MCSHYESVKDRQVLKDHFRLGDVPEGGKWDMWPAYLGPFVRRHEFADVGDDAVPEREALLGAYFSDRGRSFQRDRGRCFKLIVDAPGCAQARNNVPQKSGLAGLQKPSRSEVLALGFGALN